MEPRRFTNQNNPMKADLTIKTRMKDNDLHVVISGTAKRLTVWDKAGKRLFTCAARCDGVAGPGYDMQNGDTPPGLYQAGLVYWTRKDEPQNIWYAYGYVAIDLVELEDQELSRGRAGIMIHGGGSACANPLADYQGWAATHGCVRLQNIDSRKFAKDFVDPTKAKGGRVFVSVVY